MLHNKADEQRITKREHEKGYPRIDTLYVSSSGVCIGICGRRNEKKSRKHTNARERIYAHTHTHNWYETTLKYLYSVELCKKESVPPILFATFLY